MPEQISFSFSVQEVQYLLQVLGTRPMNEVEQLVNKVRNQIAIAQQPKTEAEAEEGTNE